MDQDHNGYNYLVKIATLGELSVGKSAIVLQFCEKRFDPEIPATLGIEVGARIIAIEGKRIKVEAWDTAGQERFRTITSSYYRGTHGFILCYAVNNRESFDKVEFWMYGIRQFASQDVRIILVGNKCDLSDERVVSVEEGLQKAQEWGIEFFETSAKKDIDVDEVYCILTKYIIDSFGDKLSEFQRLLPQENNSKEETGCFKCS